MDLSEFVAKYPPRSPKRPHDNDDQLRLLTEADGVRVLSRPPAVTDEQASPRGTNSPGKGRHLWVVRISDAPYLLETAPDVREPLLSGVAKHTNLTGGDPASCGGELWIDPTDSGHLFVNGASGRYGPDSEEQLADAASVFVAMGFRVTNFGWDMDTETPARVLRE